MLKASKKLEVEIFVVDNASADGSKEYLEKKFPKVIFKWNADNPGFGKANNSVLPEAKGEKILFLNPDTIIAEDTLELCLEFADQQKKFGGLGIRMIDGAGYFLKESKRSFPSASASIFKITGLSKIFPRSKVFSRYYAGHLPDMQNTEVDVLAGAFMMIDKKVLQITGGFDEDFFMYGEDVDLSYRIQKAGFRNFYFAGSSIIHFKGESTQKNSAVYAKHFYGAMKLFVNKHTPGRLKKGVLSTGISLMQILSSGKASIKVANNKKSRTDMTVIVANQSKFNEIIQIVKYAAAPLIIRGRIAVSKRDTDASIGKLEDIEHIMQSKDFNHMIFSESDITFKDQISVMQRLKGRLIFLFHAKGSKSIVGSSDKNVKGLFITAEN